LVENPPSSLAHIRWQGQPSALCPQPFVMGDAHAKLIAMSEFVDLYSSGGVQEPWGREYPQKSLNHDVLDSEPPDEGTAKLAGPFVKIVDGCLFMSLRDLVPNDAGVEKSWLHGWRYCSQMHAGRPHGILGQGWLLSDMPFLVANSGGAEVGIVHKAGCVSWFIPNGRGGWRPVKESREKMEHSTADRSFRFFTEEDGTLVFHSFDGGLPRQIRGRLKAGSSSFGTRIKIDCGRHDEIVKVAWIDSSSKIAEFDYEYDASVGPFPVLSSVTLRQGGKELRRVKHVCAAHEDNVMRLRLSTTESYIDGAWMQTGEIAYRYRASHWLRDVDVYEGPDSKRCAPVARYKIQYKGGGKVQWVSHEGKGCPPMYFQ